MNDNATPTIPPAEQIRTIRNRIKALLKHEERKLDKQRSEVAEAGRYVWHGQIADSLMADPASAPRGTAKGEIINIHTSEIETVSLNPAFDALGNAELLYRKSRRGKRGHDTAVAHLTETENGIERLQKALADIDEIVSEKKHDELADEDVTRVQEIAAEVLPANEVKTQGKKKNEPPSPPFKKFVIDGWEIYMGKNSTQNDELSTRFAKPSDVWMHVAGYAGSHVIIRRNKNMPPPPKDVMEKAAQIAVWNSKARNTSYAEVHVTEARFVRKRRHAPAGEVIAERCKTVRVEPKDPRELFKN